MRCTSSLVLITSVQNAKSYPFTGLRVAAFTSATRRPSSGGWTSSLTGLPLGVLGSCEHVSVLLEEISMAALIRGHNVFIYYNNKHSCKMDYKK